MRTLPGGLTTTYLIACSAIMLFAQDQQSVWTVDQIVSRIAASTEQYEATVPSFVCDERITSEELHHGTLKRQTTVESTFHVTRSVSRPGTLEESREVKTINGKPSADKELKLPISFSGGFSGALTRFVSAGHRQCFDYRPDTGRTMPTGILAFTFAANKAAGLTPSCLLIQPGTTGRFLVDEAAMQVKQIERTVAQPVGKSETVQGTAAVEFAPVTLNNKPFWLPTTITATTAETAKTDGFRFTAHYSNYHQFTATSSILPAAADPDP